MLAEQQVGAHLLRVQMRHQRLCIFGQTGSKNDELVQLVHAFEELGYEGSNQDVDRADLPVDLNWKHYICVFHGLKGRVDESLIEIEHKGLATSFRWPLRSKQVLVAKVAT